MFGALELHEHPGGLASRFRATWGVLVAIPGQAILSLIEKASTELDQKKAAVNEKKKQPLTAENAKSQMPRTRRRAKKSA